MGGESKGVGPLRKLAQNGSIGSPEGRKDLPNQRN